MSNYERVNINIQLSVKICRLSKLPWPRWQLLKLASHPQVFNIYLEAEFWKRYIINSFCAHVRAFICFCFPHAEKIYIYIQHRYFLSTRSNVVKSLFQENLCFRSFTTSEKWKRTALLTHSPYICITHDQAWAQGNFEQFVVSVLNCLAPRFDYIVMQMRKAISEKDCMLLPYSISVLTGKIIFVMW